MRSIIGAAAVVVGVLGFSPALAADVGPTRLDDQQLARITAAGTIFVGAYSGEQVLFARTFFNVPVSSERSRQFSGSGVTFVVIATEGDFLIPPLPFPQ